MGDREGGSSPSNPVGDGRWWKQKQARKKPGWTNGEPGVWGGKGCGSQSAGLWGVSSRSACRAAQEGGGKMWKMLWGQVANALGVVMRGGDLRGVGGGGGKRV